MKKDRPRRTTGKRNRPLTLSPLSFDQAIEGLLAVKPKKKATAKKKG